MKIVKKITLRDLYRRAGQIAKEAQKGVEFEVYFRKKPIFNIYAKKSGKNDDNARKREVIKRTQALIAKELRNKKGLENLSEDIDKILYG